MTKQADLVLAMHLRGDAFTAEQKARNFAYYERLTVRDSSLSACTQAVLAAEVGHLQLAHDYLAEAALMDMDDLEHNTRDGLHIASLAGAWIALVAGFGGLREHATTLSFALSLPPALSRLAFTVAFQDRRLHVEVTATSAAYQLRAGEPLQIVHDGQPVTVSTQRPLTCALTRRPDVEPITQPSGREPARRRASDASS